MRRCGASWTTHWSSGSSLRTWRPSRSGSLGQVVRFQVNCPMYLTLFSRPRPFLGSPQIAPCDQVRRTPSRSLQRAPGGGHSFGVQQGGDGSRTHALRVQAEDPPNGLGFAFVYDVLVAHHWPGSRGIARAVGVNRPGSVAVGGTAGMLAGKHPTFQATPTAVHVGGQLGFIHEAFRQHHRGR